MAFSRQREIIRTQELMWKQELRNLRRRRAARAAGSASSVDTLDTVIVNEQQQQQQQQEQHEEISIQNIAERSSDAVGEGSIFVSVASYRDSECPKTVADCFEKATYPGRVMVGVCQQNDPGDVDCLASATAQRFLPNIRVLRLQADEARGPVYARALIEQNLFHDELYYLVVDSHTLFSPGWDVECIRQLTLCPSLKPVLTCYPPEYDIRTRQLPIEQPATFLRFRDFHPRIGFTQQDPVRYKHPPPRPQPSLFWAAGFSFTLGEVVRTVPYDIHLEYVFLGEESSMAVRLWTHGYDIFAPMTNLVFHYTSRTYRPVFWERFYKKDGHSKVPHEVREQRKQLEAQGNARIKRLLAGEPLEAPYGLGTERTLLQFQEYTGLDFMSKGAARHTKLGLSPNADEEERYCKYGMQTFQ